VHLSARAPGQIRFSCPGDSRGVAQIGNRAGERRRRQLHRARGCNRLFVRAARRGYRLPLGALAQPARPRADRAPTRRSAWPSRAGRPACRSMPVARSVGHRPAARAPNTGLRRSVSRDCRRTRTRRIGISGHNERIGRPAARVPTRRACCVLLRSSRWGDGAGESRDSRAAGDGRGDLG
jgi:hypothetical protein